MESGQIQYLTLPPNYRNISRDDYSKVVAADAKSLNLFIPIRNHYNPNAATFGNFLAPSKLALTTIESLQLLGELASRAAAYDIQPAVRAQDGNVYPRVTVMYFRIPNAQGETVGRLARVFWLEGKEADEDGDITGMDNQVLKEKMIRERKQRRNIDHIMNWMIKQVGNARLLQIFEMNFAPFVGIQGALGQEPGQDQAAVLVPQHQPGGLPQSFYVASVLERQKCRARQPDQGLHKPQQSCQHPQRVWDDQRPGCDGVVWSSS